MTAAAARRKKEPIPPPGDDVVPTPARVDEEPPHDRFCDLVLTGGVASGVVYPWAIVELARAYRFRNIGGTSVGAMAAVLAAAAEYGRRVGYEAAFETLRRAPAALATVLPPDSNRTRMLSLFQTNPHGRRLILLWGRLGRGRCMQAGAHDECPEPGLVRRALREACCVYARPLLLGGLAGALLTLAALALVLVLWLDVSQPPATGVLQAAWAHAAATPQLTRGLLIAAATAVTFVIVLMMALIGAVLAALLAVWRDIRLGVIDNSYGLCKGSTTEDASNPNAPSGLTDWLHDNIQRSAGLKDDAPPLTFSDLWTAPAYPGAQRVVCGPGDPAGSRSINLQMITTSVTHGRPYRLPLEDQASRLFFRRDELEGFFPGCVLDALVASSRPYLPRDMAGDPHPDEATARNLLELPVEDMPIVVAARLSLSFPLLFAAVPLWAIDFEAPAGARTFRRCLFTDGGVSSNFPIHLFDAAVPRWPTFGFWLDRHPPYRYKDGDDDVWLPKYLEQGRGDNWNRFDPESKAVDPDPVPVGAKHKPFASTLIACPDPQADSWLSPASRLSGFLFGIVASATDWRDRTNFRMPHVRNRVARLLLRPGQGGLHIGMPREQILQMAYRYGTKAGQDFVERFADDDGKPSQAWAEQRWVRFNLLVNGLRERLDGLATSVAWSAHTEPLQEAIDAAQQAPGPIVDRSTGQCISAPQAAALQGLLHDLERLEDALQAAVPPAFASTPEPELRMRPPL